MSFLRSSMAIALAAIAFSIALAPAARGADPFPPRNEFPHQHRIHHLKRHLEELLAKGKISATQFSGFMARLDEIKKAAKAADDDGKVTKEEREAVKKGLDELHMDVAEAAHGARDNLADSGGNGDGVSVQERRPGRPRPAHRTRNGSAQ